METQECWVSSFLENQISIAMKGHHQLLFLEKNYHNKKDNLSKNNRHANQATIDNEAQKIY